jgi:hypothetical protein
MLAALISRGIMPWNRFTISANGLLFFVAFAALSGCGGAPSTYPVTVKVQYPDGQILDGAIVAFQSIPDASAGKDVPPISAIGKVGADGVGRMMTYKPGDGAVAGRHRVTVAPPPSSSADAAAQASALIHPRFKRPETSGLEATVTPDGPNEIEIRIERP